MFFRDNCQFRFVSVIVLGLQFSRHFRDELPRQPIEFPFDSAALTIICDFVLNSHSGTFYVFRIVVCSILFPYQLWSLYLYSEYSGKNLIVHLNAPY
jgi:hypothetical protein